MKISNNSLREQYMKKLEDILGNYLYAQLAFEESLYKEVEDQLSLLDESKFADVKKLLHLVQDVLETQFSRLNDSIERISKGALQDTDAKHLDDLRLLNGLNIKIRRKTVSEMLRNDYTALNLAAMGNILLHTAALAAEAKEVADVALEHLTNLTPFISQMNELVPKVVARELSQDFPKVRRAVGAVAARNARRAWKTQKK
ncbi:MAG TPA: hypothetical protein PLP17_04780 [Oligoflexia bacterium]|nr:hypothetical protein [Oligoflexia bacterium]